MRTGPNCSTALLALLLALGGPGAPHAAIYSWVEPKTGLAIFSNRNAASARQSIVFTPGTGAGRAAAPVAPVAFPRIDSRQQKELDAGRRAILREELSSEQSALDAATARHAGQEELNRHQLNIAALQRELQRLP